MKQKGSFIVLAVLIMTSIRSQYEKKKKKCLMILNLLEMLMQSGHFS